MGRESSVSTWASQERRLLMFLSSCCTATSVSLNFLTLQTPETDCINIRFWFRWSTITNTENKKVQYDTISYTIIKLYEQWLCRVQAYLMFSQGNLRSAPSLKKKMLFKESLNMGCTLNNLKIFNVFLNSHILIGSTFIVLCLSIKHSILILTVSPK